MAVARPQPGTTQDSEHTPEALLPYLAGLVASDGNIQSREAEVEVYRLKMYSRKNLELFARSFRIRHPVKIAKIGSVLGGEFVP